MTKRITTKDGDIDIIGILLIFWSGRWKILLALALALAFFLFYYKDKINRLC